MKKSIRIRRHHLQLKSACIMLGNSDSRLCKGLLAHFLKTTLPSRRTIHLCHACNNASCSNPKHLYWGTPKENVKDAIVSGRRKTLYEYMKHKYTPTECKAIWSRAGKIGSKTANFIRRPTKAYIKKFRNTVISCNPSAWGWISKVANCLKISHTHVRRLAAKYCTDISTYKRKSYAGVV